MADNTSNTSKFSPNDVNFLGNPEKKEQEVANVVQVISAKDEKRAAEQKEELNKAIREQTLVQDPQPVTVKSKEVAPPIKPVNTISAAVHKPDRVEKRTKEEKAAAKILQYLQVYATDPIGNASRISALEQVVKTALQFPVKSNFDAILKFFKDHKDDDGFREENALQCIVMLQPESRIRVEMMYHILYSTAKGTASRKNISLDAIRSVFGNDEFVNWVGTIIRKR